MAKSGGKTVNVSLCRKLYNLECWQSNLLLYSYTDGQQTQGQAWTQPVQGQSWTLGALAKKS